MLGGIAFGDASVVDQDVDGAPERIELCDEVECALGSCQVCGKVCARAGHPHHVGPGLGEGDRDPRADAPRCAGDDGGATRQIEG